MIMDLEDINYKLWCFKQYLRGLWLKRKIIKWLLWPTETYDVDERYVYNHVVEIVLRNLTQEEIEDMIDYYNLGVKPDPDGIVGVDHIFDV